MISKLRQFLVLSILYTTCLHAYESPIWTPEAMMKTRSIADVQLSPDNKTALFVVIEPKVAEEKGSMLCHIYKKNLTTDDSALLFSNSTCVSMQPRWSPDGAWIAFLSSRSGTNQLYLISAQGGEAIALTTGKYSVETFSWSPDSKHIAFVRIDEPENKKQKTSLGYVYKEDAKPKRLWVIDPFTSQPTSKPLTPVHYYVRGTGDFGIAQYDFDWSPDSQSIVFAHSPGAGYDFYYLESSLAIVHLATEEIQPLKNVSPYESTPRFSPDGNWIAYLSNDSPKGFSHTRRLAIRSIDGNEQHFLAPTYNEGPFLTGPNLLGWNKEGDHLLFFEPKGTKFHLCQVPVNGQESQEVNTKGLYFDTPCLSWDKTMLAFASQSPNTPPEAYVAKLDTFEPVQVSDINRSLLNYPTTNTQVIQWASHDGLSIEGLLTYPIGYEEGKQYPLVVVIHGGPMGFFYENFIGAPYPYPLAALAQSGFFVLRPNPRGSTGYGMDFLTANYNDWGGEDLNDILSGVDHLIAQDLVDETRMGIMGWSYGGFMTGWAITQTSQFKAASAGAGLYNLVSFCGTTDILKFLPDYLGDLDSNRALYEGRSAINYIQNVNTPCLIQHGTADDRVPVSQSYELFHALERAQKKAQFILFPGMDHRPADPNMYLDIMKQNLEWFKEHL